jgi:Ran GTPase-activating protein (RanGAP) involved in mRNA processing and transport
VVKPEFVTGGESLAALLLTGTCPIEKLVLHWNMIRLDGAIALCNAIHANRHLTYLDLSYNAIGCAGAEILGKSLIENSILTKLNVAHNGINAVGCFALCVGVAENSTLREFNIDGNPIGAHGCMILTKTVVSSNPLLMITAQHCDFLIKYDNVKFDVTGTMILCGLPA